MFNNFLNESYLENMKKGFENPKKTKNICFNSI